MSSPRTAPYQDKDTIEACPSKNCIEQLETQGHYRRPIPGEYQPQRPLPGNHALANPSPLGLLSFATGIFVLSMLGVHTRSIEQPNMAIGVLLCFGGICQFLSGIMEFINGNKFGATVFPSYGAFNLSFAMIFLPGTGIQAAYTNANGDINSTFYDAVGVYCWAWFILTVIYTIAAVRSSWVLFTTLLLLCVELLLLAVGYMLRSDPVLVAGNSVGFVVAFCSYWAGCAALWADLTPLNIRTFPMDG
ncbi:GPR1/FUN34/yaaH family-domain-containing protein [Aspergillus californicus]